MGYDDFGFLDEDFDGDVDAIDVILTDEYGEDNERFDYDDLDSDGDSDGDSDY